MVMIDMQRDFVEEGGFGSTLGNNVKLLQAIVPTVRLLLVSALKLLQHLPVSIFQYLFLSLLPSVIKTFARFPLVSSGDLYA